MTMSDRTAELYELADHVAFDSELKRILTGKRLHDLADQWKAERQACKSAAEEADRLRFAAEAQAAADRDALALARSALSEIEREARNQITAPDTNAAQMVVSEAVAETCRRIADVLEGGAR